MHNMHYNNNMNTMHKTSKVARELGVTVHHVNRWIRQCKIAAFKLPSGHYLISDEELKRIKKDGVIERG